MSKMILIDEAKLSSVLEAIKMLVRFESDSWELGSCRIANRAISALREALAEQPAPVQQEPVAWYHAEDYKTHFTSIPSKDLIESGYWKPLYTSPPAQRTWVDLTDEEIDMLEELYAPPVHPDFVSDADQCFSLIKKVEAKLKEKNNG